MNKPEPIEVYEWPDISRYLSERHPQLNWDALWSNFTRYHRRGEIMGVHWSDIKQDGFDEIAAVIKKEFEKNEVLILYDW